MQEFDSQNTPRRNFLLRCCQAAAAFFVPQRRLAAAPAPHFHLHPHYREQTPLDAELLQIAPGLDGFPTERDHDKIAAILHAWSASLLLSPQTTEALDHAISAKFTGASWHPLESVSLRPISSSIEVRRLRFTPEPSLGWQAFAASLKSSLSPFSQILTAEFQITAIDPSLTTQVRYELVGSGQGFYREQRTGNWTISWEFDSKTGYRLVRWLSHEETRSRSSEPFFIDISHSAFGANSSYSAQLLHGVDYWRTVIDGASGIDIYGHNGVSVGDIDGDGRDDIYICQPAGLPNRLYRNLGNGAFEDITESSGLGLLDNTACALFADFNNNGHQDLIVVRANGPLLFLNDGNGRFHLKPDAFQFATPPQGTFTGAAAADYDRDGHLEIYFCLYVYYQGVGQYKYPTPYFAAENGPPNFLMRNNGDGTFKDVTAQSGLDKNNTRFSFCCGWSDYNHDGWPDLYVVNDFGRKNLYRNNGDGTFTDVAPESGVEDIGAGMSVCWLDYNNDGAEDLYVGNMWTAAGERLSASEPFQETASPEVQSFYRKHAMGNSLFRNENGSFRNVTDESHTGMGRWSWSSDAWDFDHDGFADIYVANGMISGANAQDLSSFFWRQVVAKSPNTAKSSSDYELGWNAINDFIRAGYSWSGFERNVLYANNRDGTFSDISGALGIDFLEDGRAFALADFDGDGRQELLLKNRNAPQVRLIKNTWAALPSSISFRLQGTRSNRDAIGASVAIETSAGRQTKMLQAGSGFLSQHSKELFFGLGDAKGNISGTIRWPSGNVQHLKDLPSNHRVTIIEGAEPTLQPYLPTAGNPPEQVFSPPDKALSPTWLLAPVTAPILSPDREGGFALKFDTPKDDDTSAVYNLLFRYLFDSHRDLTLPTSFLIDEHGQIVKVYQGPVDATTVQHDLAAIPQTTHERLQKALPFRGVSATYEYGRNYLSLGSIFFQRGYLGPSETFFQSALKDDPSNAEALYGLGSIYLKQQKDNQAREAFERAARLKSSYPETTPNAWNNLGLLAARQGDTPKAIGHFQEALRLNPDSLVALENLGNAYRQEKRWGDARSTLLHALAIKPDDPEANYSLGMVFAQLDDTAESQNFLEKALQARPAYPEALNNLGVLYLRTRRRDQAVAAFEKCIRVAPAFDQSYLNLARVYALEGDSEKAKGLLRDLLKQQPDHGRAKQALDQLSGK